MKRASVVVVLLAVLAFPVAAGEGSPVTLKVQEIALAKAAELVGPMVEGRVIVAAALEGKPVSVSLEGVPPEEALSALAKAAGTKLERLADDVWWIGPPAIDRAGKIGEALDAKRLALRFEDAALADVLRIIGATAQVAIQVDPELLRVRTPDELALTLAADDVPARKALQLATELLGLAWDVRWGGVLVSTEDRLKSLPRTTLGPPEGPISIEETVLRARLAREEVSFDFADAPASMVLEFIGAALDIPFATDEKVKSGLETTAVTATAHGLSLEHSLDLVLLPRGFTWTIRGDGIAVTRR